MYTYLRTFFHYYFTHLLLHYIAFSIIIVQATQCHVVAILYSLTHYISLSTSVPAPYQVATSVDLYTHTSPSPLIPHPSTMHVPLTTTPCPPPPPPQQNVYAPEEDPELKVELYTHSPEQNELLGLDQMNVD